MTACEADATALAKDVAGCARLRPPGAGSVQPGPSSCDRPHRFGTGRGVFRVEADEPIEPAISLRARRKARTYLSSDRNPRGLKEFVVAVHAPIVAQHALERQTRICRESRDSHRAVHWISRTDARGARWRCVHHGLRRSTALRTSAAFVLQQLILTRGATCSMRGSVHSSIARIARHDADHSSLNAASAEERARGRGEFAEPPAGVDPLQHQYDKGALQIRTGRESSSLQQSAVHVSDADPARLFRGLQRIEGVGTADHGENLSEHCGSRPSSNPQCNKLYGSGARCEQQRLTAGLDCDVVAMSHPGRQ
jgi:hypothetical protein